MKLAFRLSPDSEQWNHVAANAIIRARLVTDFPHAGIVIGDTLYHATASDGLHSEEFGNRPNWITKDLGHSRDAAVLRLFDKHQGAGYDWFSLLAFALIPARDSRRFYCYEWCYLAMTGENPNHRVTPETLLKLSWNC